MRISEITPEYQGKTLPGQALPSENSSQPMERLPEYQPKHSENLGEKKSGVIGKTLKNQDSRIKEEKLRHKKLQKHQDSQDLPVEGMPQRDRDEPSGLTK